MSCHPPQAGAPVSRPLTTGGSLERVEAAAVCYATPNNTMASPAPSVTGGGQANSQAHPSAFPAPSPDAQTFRQPADPDDHCHLAAPGTQARAPRRLASDSTILERAMQQLLGPAAEASMPAEIQHLQTLQRRRGPAPHELALEQRRQTLPHNPAMEQRHSATTARRPETALHRRQLQLEQQQDEQQQQQQRQPAELAAQEGETPEDVHQAAEAAQRIAAASSEAAATSNGVSGDHSASGGGASEARGDGGGSRVEARWKPPDTAWITDSLRRERHRALVLAVYGRPEAATAAGRSRLP